MQPCTRLQGFRKQIRREQLDSLFSAKRIKLLEDPKTTSLKENEMQPEKQNQQAYMISQNMETLSLEQLKKYSKLSQTEQGIEAIHKSQLHQLLLNYMREEYAQTDQQFHATYILCNLYYLPSVAPDQSLALNISNLLDQADMRTLENLFFLLNNVITNFPEWLTLLVNNYHFIERLANLFKRFEKPTVSYLEYLLQIIFKCMQKAGKEEKFLKIKLPLIKLIMQKQSNEIRELIKKAVYCYYLLIKHFPLQATPNIVKFGILTKMLELTPFFSQKKYTLLVLQMIELSLHELEDQNVQKMIMPYLNKLAQIGFQFGDKSPYFQARQLKIQAYTLLRRLLQSYKLSIECFMSLKLAQNLLQQFQALQDQDLLEALSYVFVQVWLNTQNLQIKANIMRLIQRAQIYNKDRIQFNVYLKEFSNSI